MSKDPKVNFVKIQCTVYKHGKDVQSQQATYRNQHQSHTIKLLNE